MRPPILTRRSALAGAFMAGAATTALLGAALGFAPRERAAFRPEDLGVVAGETGAPVTVLEFSDFQCPFCADFAAETGPALRRKYADTGEVRFIYLDYPLPQHRHAQMAARAARCAEDQRRFWAYHDELFRSQGDWGSARDPLVLFRRYASDLGLDRSRFERCLASARHDETIRRNVELGRSMGVRGTPWILVDGAPVPNSLPMLEHVIVTAVAARAGRTPDTERSLR